MALLKTPAMDEEKPMAVVAEGARPQAGVWPEVTTATPPAEMTADAGNGHSMRETFLRHGTARDTEEYRQLLAAREAEDAA